MLHIFLAMYNDKAMPNDEITTNEIMMFLKGHMATKEDLGSVNEILDFIKENMVTKDELDLKLMHYAMKEDFERIERKLTEFKSEILTAIDQFVKKHDTLDTEQIAMRGRFERLEDRVDAVEEQVGLLTAT